MNAAPDIRQNAPLSAPRPYAIALLIAGIVIGGLWLVSRYAQADLARDMQTWQEKLGLIAESRTSDVDQWLSGNFKELRALSDNPSLQLYMTELESLKDNPGDTSQQAYLRNLLVFTAQRAGFGGHSTNIPASVQSDDKSGLAVIDKQGRIIASTEMQPATRDALLAEAAKAPAGKESLIDLRKDKDGTATIGFTVPVYSIQGEHDADSQIGRIVGIKVAGDTLFALLKTPGVTEKTLEAILLRDNAGTIEYLSPLQDGTQALGRQAAADSAEAKGIQPQGPLLTGDKDYRGQPVLATSRRLAGAPWTLMVKVDEKQALGASNQRRHAMETAFVLLVAAVALGIAAIWWRTYSKQALITSRYFRALALERERHLKTQHQVVNMLLKLVDARDPFSANHSLLVSQLSYAVASDMGLDPITADTAKISGNLMNIGKIVVPPELLTKKGNLDANEKRIIQESMKAAADFLDGISFDGPVAETVRQWQERWDGKGPLGLAGENILITARIIAASNVFIGMVSPRSWRTAIPVSEASAYLLQQSNTLFDHRVVIALINYVENHNGKAWLQDILGNQKHVA